MNDKDQTIYDFDFSLVCEYFSGLERQGPGSEKATLQALSFVDNLTDKSRIADIGCGTGGQTITLAKNAPGHITAVDLFPTFINTLRENAKKNSLDGRIDAVTGSMEELKFADGELDLIWCEGAIYNIGFTRGLNEWRKFLKKGGYIAVSEASWFTEKRPAEIERFWQEAYPEITTVPSCVEIMRKAGYNPKAVFELPETCWTENFYDLQTEAQKEFLNRHPDSKPAEHFVEYQRREAELYRKYKEFYGYVFYIGQKI